MGSCFSVRDDRELDEHCQGGTSTSETDKNSALIEDEECRICFDKQTSVKDPVVHLGCKCLGDLSCAHQSCIRKWFPAKSVDSGAITCEVCMESLGQEAQLIVKIERRSKVFHHFVKQGLAYITQILVGIVMSVANSIQSSNELIEEMGHVTVRGDHSTMEDSSMVKREICMLEQNLEASIQKNEELEKMVEELTKKNKTLASKISWMKWQHNEVYKRLYEHIAYFRQTNMDAIQHQLSCPNLQGENKWHQLKTQFFNRSRVGPSASINRNL